MSGMSGIGRGRAGAREGGAHPREFLELEDRAGALPSGLDPSSLWGLDAADEAEGLAESASATAEVLAHLEGRPRTVDEALAAPSPEHVARALDPGRVSEALARVVRRGARPGESVQEARLRALVGRLLELRHEASAGIGKVSVG